jgi:V/A-type H+-transporting ATPase subunit D
MADLRRMPPGRAGRLWLMARLRSARLAADLLERKLRILRTEQQRFAMLTRRTGERWRADWLAADRWGVRGALLGGQREVRLSTTAAPAEVEVAWASVMGVRYPAGADCRAPEPSDADRGPGTAALVEATTAYRAAMTAAVAHAAAEAARRTVDAEVAATRRRRRAIADRWIPRLETALRELTAELEETERAETVRLRWAAAHARPGGGVP